MSKEGDTSLFDDIVSSDDYITIGEDGNVISEEASQGNGEEKSGAENTTKTTEEDLEIDLLDTDTLAAPTDDGNSSEGQGSKSSTEDPNTSSQSPISSVAEILGAEGFIEYDQEELNNAEDPAEYIRQKYKEKIEDEIKNGLTPAQKEALEAYEKGVPMKEFTDSKARQTQYENVTMAHIDTNTNNVQAALVEHAMLAKGMSKEDVKDYVETLDEEKLKSKAIESHQFLVEREKALREQMKAEAVERQKEAEVKREKSLKDLKEHINKQDSIIEDLSLTDKDKEDLYKIMTSVVGNTENGNPITEIGKTRLQDPTAFDIKLAYYYKLGLFNEKPDFSKLIKVAEKKAANGLKSLVDNPDTSFLKSGGSKGGNTPANEDDPFGFYNTM